MTAGEDETKSPECSIAAVRRWPSGLKNINAFTLYWAERSEQGMWISINGWCSSPSGLPGAPAGEEGVSTCDSARVSVTVTPQVMHFSGCHGTCVLVCRLSVWPYKACRLLHCWHVGASRRTPHDVFQRVVACYYVGTASANENDDVSKAWLWNEHPQQLWWFHHSVADRKIKCVALAASHYTAKSWLKTPLSWRTCPIRATWLRCSRLAMSDTPLIHGDCDGFYLTSFSIVIIDQRMWTDAFHWNVTLSRSECLTNLYNWSHVVPHFYWTLCNPNEIMSYSVPIQQRCRFWYSQRRTCITEE